MFFFTLCLHLYYKLNSSLPSIRTVEGLWGVVLRKERNSVHTLYVLFSLVWHINFEKWLSSYRERFNPSLNRLFDKLILNLYWMIVVIIVIASADTTRQQWKRFHTRTYYALLLLLQVITTQNSTVVITDWFEQCNLNFYFKWISFSVHLNIDIRLFSCSCIE